MSWNGECRIEATMTAQEAADTLGAMEIRGGDNAPEETKQAASVAREAVKMLLFSGALGKPPGSEGSSGFHVSVNGHANAGHRPTDGWANDRMTINVQQLPGPG